MRQCEARPRAGQLLSLGAPRSVLAPGLRRVDAPTVPPIQSANMKYFSNLLLSSIRQPISHAYAPRLIVLEPSNSSKCYEIGLQAQRLNYAGPESVAGTLPKNAATATAYRSPIWGSPGFSSVESIKGHRTIHHDVSLAAVLRASCSASANSQNLWQRQGPVKEMDSPRECCFYLAH